MNGQSLNIMKEFLKPVKSETTESIFSIPNDIQYIELKIMFVLSIYVTNATRKPIKMRLIPSIIHSIVMIYLLSGDISPKLPTTFLVGNRCAAPHPNTINEPIYIKISPAIFAPPFHFIYIIDLLNP